MSNNLPAKRTPTFSYSQEVALSILSQPKKGGLTFAQIAEKCEISEKQLRRWRQSDVFAKELQRRTLLNMNEDLPQIANVLREKALGGNMKAIELYLKSLSILQERHIVVPVQNEDVEFNSRSSERIEAEIEELRKILGETEVEVNEA